MGCRQLLCLRPVTWLTSGGGEWRLRRCLERLLCDHHLSYLCGYVRDGAGRRPFSVNKLINVTIYNCILINSEIFFH